jgi:serine/threonine protein phosphatase PrpC
MVTGDMRPEAKEWTAIGATARGAMHVKSGLPNQDCHAYIPATRHGDGIILAVADGHGDPRCVRAEVGARFAVAAATERGRDFMDATFAEPSATFSSGVVANELVPSIVAEWRAAVARHLAEHPWSADERAAIDVRAGGQMPYGCTLLVAAILGRVLVLVQIGDGDILAVRADGAVDRPIGPAAALVGGETLSLATNDTANASSVALLELDEATRLVLLATDGYANSFDDSAWEHPIGADYMRLLEDHGPEWIEDQLPEWVEASAAAAGDDVTVLLAVRR